jgi:hypothetical protein
MVVGFRCFVVLIYYFDRLCFLNQLPIRVQHGVFDAPLKIKCFYFKINVIFLYNKTFSNISSKNFIASVSIRRSISCFTDSEIIERNPFIVIFFVWVSLSVYKIEFSLFFIILGNGHLSQPFRSSFGSMSNLLMAYRAY